MPEDLLHAKNTLVWLLRIDPRASQALRIAAFAHDVERAFECKKIHRMDFNDFDVFKASHASNSSKILMEILTECDIHRAISLEACSLVLLHETGGNANADLLMNVDSISYFDVNLPLYYQREGWAETKRRSVWGYQRLSPRGKGIVNKIKYAEEILTGMLYEVIDQANPLKTRFS
ncbi:MAG: DUF4202 family protein [Candidatus Marinimicrobia bacterium]|nr:DUF4202 family protein [Candidatus Neomarinimicrobiota bacterium]